MPPVRTLLFLVPLVKALRPSTTPAKQLSTASSIKARVASQKAVGDNTNATATSFSQAHVFWEPPHFLSLWSVLPVNFVRLTVSSCLFFFAPPTSLRVSAQSAPHPVPHHPPALHQQSASPGVHRLVGTSSLMVCVCAGVLEEFPISFLFGLVDVSACLSEQRNQSISLNLSLFFSFTHLSFLPFGFP